MSSTIFKRKSNVKQILVELSKLYPWLCLSLFEFWAYFVVFLFSVQLKKITFQVQNRSSWSRGSVPSSHARGQRFKPRRRQYFKLLWPRRFFTPTPAESLPNLNPAFLLSASRPFNRWPSVWFGSLLCGISIRPKYPGHWRRRALMTNDGKLSLLPLHCKLSSLDGAQAGPAWTPSTIYT